MKPVHIKTPARTQGSRRHQQAHDTEDVAVYCRLRPLSHGSSDSSSASSEYDGTTQRCVHATDTKTLRLSPPETSRAFYAGRTAAQLFSFRAVFDENSTQADVFSECGLPLVRDLLRGQNGLLFAYGVTGSGKTYTMQGTPADGGVVIRAIDVIFNSIRGKQTSRKFMLRSNRANNDFEVKTTAEAMAEQQAEMIAGMRGVRGYHTRSNTSDQNLSNRLPDETSLDVDKDKMYAVFVSYCEIYNKYIFDLLEDETESSKPAFKPESKVLRKDKYGSTFVYNSTEREVRDPREALELFYRGQKQRRVAHTQMNLESSRSHSIFNIRLVRCTPADEDEIDPSGGVVISQLALVDLAGSERTSRTGTTGDRLREAGNINNSLMNLRMCIERLRENQRTGRSGGVPYQSDKLTRLFQSYFEGIGTVKMIVAINPRVCDYDENVNVLQFAEMAQEIEIDRCDPITREVGLTPARARAQMAFQAALDRPETDVDAEKLNRPFSPIYSLGPVWPAFNWKGFEDDTTLPNLHRFLKQRLATRNTLVQDHAEKYEEFRGRLVALEEEVALLRQEKQQLRAGWDGEKRRTRDLEKRLVNAEAANTSLQRRVEAFCEAKNVLENELDEKELELNQQRKETKKVVRRLRSHVATEHRKRSAGETHEANEDGGQQFKGVGSRIAEMEARCNNVNSKRFRI